jgi:hypothetical protein
MKSAVFIPDRSETATDRAKGWTPRLDDPFAVTKKALERWENEGGRIPEVGARYPRNSWSSADADHRSSA